LNLLDTKHYTNLSESRARGILSAPIPYEIHAEIQLPTIAKQTKRHKEPWVAVRSSATAEDLRQQVLLDKCSLSLILVVKPLIDAVHRCYVSLFTDRAIKYRHDMGLQN
jgi:pyruvate,water dikinase